MKDFLKFLLAIFLFAVLLVFNGLTFSFGWNTFLSTTFNIQEITNVQSIGLITLYSYLTSAFKTKKEETENTFSEIFKSSFLSIFKTGIIYLVLIIVAQFL